MDFALTQEQRDLTSAVRRYLADSYPPDRIAELADGGPGSGTGPAWTELGRQGWLDDDLGTVELGLLAEESGYALHPTSWWATAALAAPVYRAAGLAPVTPATLAWAPGECRATPAGAGWLLLGGFTRVVDAAAAAELVVAARTDAGVALFGIAPDAPGARWSHRRSVDPLRRLSDLEVADTPARLLVAAPAAGPLLDAVTRRAAALLACEAVGVGARALDLAVDHAKVRVQFDRPIGSYQAVAHQLAEAYAEVELARSLAYRAICETSPGGEPLGCAIHAARRAALLACETAIQVCGGIGATWEFPLHRWYRRALWLAAYTTVTADPLDVVAAHLFDQPVAP